MRSLWALAGLMLGTSVALAATPAGTLIRNQASATFTDVDGRRVTVTSNLVETRVEQVAGLQLSADAFQRVAPGVLVELPHRLVNTGNGDDSYALQVQNLAGDNIDVSSLQILVDRDGDGRADNDAALDRSPVLAAGEGIDLIIRARVPASASDGSVARLRLEARSTLDSSLVDTDTDTLTVGTGADVTLTKSMSATSGESPSGAWQVTLRYANRGTSPAGDITLMDALPPGMSYVAGSGRWSGADATLSDADPLDAHAGPAASIRYCAYDASCSGLPGATLSSSGDAADQVTAIIDYVPPGAGGTVSFDVLIDAGLSQQRLLNQAEFEYDVAIDTVPRALGNVVSFEVLPTYGVVANGSTATAIPFMAEPVQVISAPAGSTVAFDNIVWNTGNRRDTFTLEVDTAGSTFPQGSLWRLLRADGATPLLDTDGDGLADTGPVEPGAFVRVVMAITLPADAAGDNDGLGFDIEKTARSVGDGSVFDPVIDHLGEIVAAGVDLTNAAPAGSDGALGVGQGPEASPVTVRNADRGEVVRFDLFVAHDGSQPTRYLPSVTTLEGEALPDGWRVQFVSPADGSPVLRTAALDTGEHEHLIAQVTVPADAEAGRQSLRFQVRSEQGSVADAKHDAVLVGSDATLRLEPALQAQVDPGGSVVYAHRLSNDGNVPVSEIELGTRESLDGWRSVVWFDTDDDAQLGPGDVPVSGAFALAAGESRGVLVQVYAPAEAPLASENATVLEARRADGSEPLSLTDLTRVTDTRVAIVKRQAVDVGCDGVPDPGRAFETGGIEIAPGDNCVIYRLTATNTGTRESYNVAILDYTPPWTVYHPGASCSRQPCWLTVPSPGQAGALNAATDALGPGESYFLEFSVKVR